jgi:hypothetical protein
MRRSVFFAAFFSLLALATPGLAQEADVTLSPAPPAAPVLGAPVTPAVVAPHAAVVVAPAPAAPPRVEDKPKADDKDKEEKDSAHFRFGMGLDADFLFAPAKGTAGSAGAVPGIQGFGAGLALRLGAQINQWFAMYYQPHLVLGGTVSESAPPVPNVPGFMPPKLPSATVIGAVFNSVLLEATLPVLQIGAGPSLDVLGIKGFSLLKSDPGSTNAYFGVDGRVAIVIGGHGPGSHAGFAINANVHPTFWTGGVLTTFSLGLGGELY